MADDIYVTVETQQVAEVMSVGIQGVSGSASVALSLISDVDSTLLEDGSVLVYNMSTAKWTSTRILEKQKVIGGKY